jgi:glycosyltransferase involved in cell wall biosynthesis
LPRIRKVLYVSTLTAEFARNIYGVPENKLEFYPLGGHPIGGADYERRRDATRAALELNSDNIVFLQSGKQSRPKYLKQALEAFSSVRDSRFRFLIVGVLMDEIRDEVEPLIAADERVSFMGWKSPDALEELLCAADVYLQPGRQSSTMQTSMCCHCAVVLENLPSHRLYVDGNGWLLDRPEEIASVFAAIHSGKQDIEAMKARSLTFACQNLDYSVLAERVLK